MQPRVAKISAASHQTKEMGRWWLVGKKNVPGPSTDRPVFESFTFAG